MSAVEVLTDALLALPGSPRGIRYVQSGDRETLSGFVFFDGS